MVCGNNGSFRKTNNVFERSNFDAYALYKQMAYAKNSKRTEEDWYIEWIKDLSIQIGKSIYPSHFDFLTLEHGKVVIDDADEIYIYITRIDGNKGVVPEKLAEKANIRPIKLIIVYEARTGERVPEGGYYFKSLDIKNDFLLKYAVVVSRDRGEEWIKSLKELENLYLDISKARDVAFSDKKLIEELRGNCGYSRDGYL